MPIFNDDGSLLAVEETNKLSSSIPATQIVAFKLNFKHNPQAFSKMECKLQARCNEVGVACIRPTIADSVQDTLKRKATLNRAIKAAKQNLSGNAMTKEERKKRSAKQMEHRQNKMSKESEGEKLKRLKREADCQKKQGDIKFDNYCKRMRVPCPPPRQNDDTGTTTRAHRKICRDAIKDREEKKIRKEQKRRRNAFILHN